MGSQVFTSDVSEQSDQFADMGRSMGTLTVLCLQTTLVTAWYSHAQLVVSIDTVLLPRRLPESRQLRSRPLPSLSTGQCNWPPTGDMCGMVEATSRLVWIEHAWA